MLRHASWIVLCGAIASLAAGEPESPVLVSEFIYEKAPFPSCHASTIAETKDGLVAAWFGGTDEGDADVGIWVSRHDGKAWSPVAEVATGLQKDGKRHPCWNPVLFDATDRLLLFYKVGPSPSKWWGAMRSSTDGGKSWSDERRLPDGVLGPIKNKPVLVDGRLLCPSSTEHDGWRIHVESTADWGRSWTATKPLNEDRAMELIQPSLLDWGKARLQMLCRSQQGKVYETWSEDNGASWSKPQPTVLPNPNSGIDAVRLADGRALLVYNPTSKGERTPLSIAVSPDGKTWTSAVVLEDAPGEYSYPAVIQSRDGLIHVTYTWNRTKIRHAVIDPKRIK